MRKTINYLKMSDGEEIYTVVYMPEEDIKGHVHILHGMAEHIGRYEEFATFLTDSGYMVSGHDHRGHGHTGQKQEQFGFFDEKDGFERVTEDVREILQAIRINLEIPPPILFTHSMGTFIGRRYIQKYGHSISKIILSGTRGPLSPVDKAGKWIAKGFAAFQGKKTENNVLNKLSFEKFNSAVSHPDTKFDWLSTDSIQVKKYIDDPYCGFIASNQFFVDLIDGLTKINDMNEMKKIPKDLPVLLMSGALDPVGKMGKDLWPVAEQYKRLGLKDVTVVIKEGRRHELLNEVDYKETYNMVLTWMEKT